MGGQATGIDYVGGPRPWLVRLGDSVVAVERIETAARLVDDVRSGRVAVVDGHAGG